MNIFYLDSDPKLCAQYHNNRHVVKMILESAQLLCTALNVSAGEQVTPYKTTHVNHPCSIWARESFANWYYVYCLMFHLESEWNLRYNHKKKHKSANELLLHTCMVSGKPESIVDVAKKYLSNRPFSPPALAMPDEYKTSDPVESYRRYYKEAKKDLNIYTNREKPFWLENLKE
jgi:hypothetical protein